MKTLFVMPESARRRLHQRYADVIEVNPRLSRALVSYQSNRGRPKYRWFKYKEGFSAGLVEYLFAELDIQDGVLLDPFAGSGAALFGAREHGLASRGIELLPVGIRVIEARRHADAIAPSQLKRAISRIAAGDWRAAADQSLEYRHLRITEGAFPRQTEREIAQFRTFVRDRIANESIRSILDLAAMSVLESVSFTRKDGQYLRWDSRAPRKLAGKPFDKGPILDFETALLGRLRDILEDLEDPGLFASLSNRDVPEMHVDQGSCLDVLPTIPADSVDVLLTSPPYCNRYDYTRTYALELAYLGVDEPQLKQLRQALLSCTVENRSKQADLERAYDQLDRRTDFAAARRAFDGQEGLHEVLQILDRMGDRGELNNVNVPRMVRNYFFESAVSIFEWARILRPGASVVVVNDNVRYGGEEVPVDLILCDIAEEAGFSIERIWTLDRGKGNSSQQMGAHGRTELRKCVYLWRRS